MPAGNSAHAGEAMTMNRCRGVLCALASFVAGVSLAPVIAVAETAVPASNSQGTVHLLPATMETTQWGWYDNAQKPVRGAHTLTGPIYVEGAEPGDVLAVHINKIIPRPYGMNVNYPGVAGL